MRTMSKARVYSALPTVFSLQAVPVPVTFTCCVCTPHKSLSMHRGGAYNQGQVKMVVKSVLHNLMKACMDLCIRPHDPNKQSYGPVAIQMLACLSDICVGLWGSQCVSILA